MLLPQILKRIFYPKRMAAGRATSEEHHPGADRTPARSGEEVLRKAAEQNDDAPPAPGHRKRDR